MNTDVNRPVRESFSEVEAARELGISIKRLHSLLDEYVFNDGTPRPPDIELTSPDLLLLKYWNRCMPDQKVVCMPKPQY